MSEQLNPLNFDLYHSGTFECILYCVNIKIDDSNPETKVFITFSTRLCQYGGYFCIVLFCNKNNFVSDASTN